MRLSVLASNSEIMRRKRRKKVTLMMAARRERCETPINFNLLSTGPGISSCDDSM